MISNYQFQALSENEKAEVTWSGTFLGNRSEDGFKILLYRVDDLYVEVYYNDLLREIVEFRTFKSLHQLAPYL